KKFLKKINYVGVMGVEFFVTPKALIVNEIAPRVHNTGHYSTDTLGLSQFDVHNMCLMNLPLPKFIKTEKGFAMVNLIGQNKEVQLAPCSGLYWYGKVDNRAGRKMGHINTTGPSPSVALKDAKMKRQRIDL
ncbi:MAG: ATP-grasp domain-containing protein, partial [Pseudomonadota bacterium]